MKGKIYLIGIMLTLAACGSVKPENYAAQKPELKINQFYSSDVEGYGYYKDRSGKVESRYFVRLVPKWNGNTGDMTEYNYEVGGKATERTWQIHLTDANHFTANGSDLVGTLEGEMFGYAMHMKYTLLVPHNDSKIAIDFDDWTYLQPDGTAINEVALSKYGFDVGSLTYNLHKSIKTKKAQTSFY